MQGPYLCDTKHLDRRLAAMQSPFFNVDRLEANLVRPLIEAVQARSRPLLVLLRIFLLETAHVLRELLQDFFFELTLGLTRPEMPVNAIAALPIDIQLPLL